MLAENWQLVDVARAADGAALAESWSHLTARAMSPAARNHPAFAVPVLQAVADAEVLSVSHGGQLLAALPARLTRNPLPYWTNVLSPLANGGAFHLDRQDGGAALNSLVGSLDAPVSFHAMTTHGPIWDAVQRAGGQIAVLDQWERAVLRLDGTFEDWLNRNIDGKRRKEYRRLRNRLSEQGQLEAQSLKPGEDVSAWADDLLRLEAAGWKGERGTALDKQGLGEAFRAIARGMHAAGKLRFWRLQLDGRTIASLFAVVEGSEAWLGKIAYDQGFAKYSPGVLCILDATQALFAEEALSFVDSCAIPNHPMIDHIWRDRLPVADVMVAGARVNTMQFRATVAMERANRALRAAARDTYHAIKGTRRS